MSNEVAVVSKSTQQVVTHPGRSLQHVAERLFTRSNHAGSEQPVETVRQRDDRVTAQDLADFNETMERLGPPAVRDAAIADAQRLMTTYGTDALRKVVAERGMGSNVHVMDIAARLQRALDAKDQEIAALRGRR